MSASAASLLDFSLAPVPGRSVDAVLDEPLIELGQGDLLFVSSLDQVAERLLRHVMDGEPEQPRNVVAEMAEAGLFSQYIDESLGGTGTGGSYSTLLCRIRETFGYYAGTLDMLFGRQGVGSCAIVMMGSDEQRRRFLPDLIHGRKLFAFALTEPLAGSDVLGMQTRAERATGGYVLNGAKAFISGVDQADVVIVFARTGDGRHGSDISGFIVERGTPGFTTAPMPESTAPHGIGTLLLQDCFVPSENLIGGEGKGLHGALGTLEVYRASIGAMTTGMARRAFDLAVAYARSRQAFGRALIELEATRSKLAEMWVEIVLARVLAYRAAALRDQGTPSLREAGMAKLFGTEAAQRVVYEAQQIHGGRGVLQGNEIELQFRELRPATIYEGSSEVQRTIIARAEIRGGLDRVVNGEQLQDLPDVSAFVDWLAGTAPLDPEPVVTALAALTKRATVDGETALAESKLWLGDIAARAAGLQPAAALPLLPTDPRWHPRASSTANDDRQAIVDLAADFQGAALCLAEREGADVLCHVRQATPTEIEIQAMAQLPSPAAPRLVALQHLAMAAVRVGVAGGRYENARSALCDSSKLASSLSRTQWIQFLVADCATLLDASSLTVSYACRMLATAHREALGFAVAADIASARALDCVDRLALGVGESGRGIPNVPACAEAATMVCLADLLFGGSES